MVYATSSTPIIRQRDFKRGFLQLLFSDLEKEIDRALSSLQFRYNGSLHAEAIGMALACSVHKARPVEAELPQQLSYLKPIFEFDTIASRQLWYVLKIDRSIQSPSVFARSAASAAILSRLSSPAFMMVRGALAIHFRAHIPPSFPAHRTRLLEIFHISITAYVKSAPAQSAHHMASNRLPLASDVAMFHGSRTISMNCTVL
ncbi:hypothetical protein BD309DRAFT_615411 [Dichomitus squalens]|nr:hypothetical protein BD309DRAFT_615411 [Dichomitus squalens]